MKRISDRVVKCMRIQTNLVVGYSNFALAVAVLGPGEVVVAGSPPRRYSPTERERRSVSRWAQICGLGCLDIFVLSVVARLVKFKQAKEH